MITERLFETVLKAPALQGNTTLLIISGYATAAMAYHHLHSLKQSDIRINVSLLIGMCPLDGISVSNHKAFQRLVTEDFRDLFTCSYVYQGPPVHSKVYCWLRENQATSAYCGSANYTQTGFLGRHFETVSTCDPLAARAYIETFRCRTIDCQSLESDQLVQVYHDHYNRRARIEETVGVASGVQRVAPGEFSDLDHVQVSLLDRDGLLPSRSGLNWGQRPEYNRESNQAYIRLNSAVYRSNFFPERGQHFTVLTDDQKVLICTRAQDNGKAIETPENNSLIGLYFRARLGLASGDLVTIDHLRRFGRTSIDFYKIDSETYYMDFSPLNG